MSTDKRSATDNSKAVVRRKEGQGNAVYAVEPIKKGEIIAVIDGKMLPGEVWDDLPEDERNYQYDHAIQVDEYVWRASDGIADQLNHSCDPNCGIHGLYDIVTMRDIEAGEELVWDYEMTEDYQWRMDCMCSSHICRKRIGAFGNMPNTIREKYKGYISDWLVDKYSLENVYERKFKRKKSNAVFE